MVRIPRDPTCKATLGNGLLVLCRRASHILKQGPLSRLLRFPVRFSPLASVHHTLDRWRAIPQSPYSVLTRSGCSEELPLHAQVNGFSPVLFSSVECDVPGLGYLLGPSVGSAGWKLSHRRLLPLIESRERDFHRRIVRNRVDPRAQSATNPVPDFYGKNLLRHVSFDTHILGLQVKKLVLYISIDNGSETSPSTGRRRHGPPIRNKNVRLASAASA